MKIIIIHYRYYKASGPEKYLFSITDLLIEKGHTVIPFSVNYSQNKETPYSEYFPTPVVDEFHINQNRRGISFANKLKIISNTFYNKEAFSKLTTLIDIEKPDLVYVLQYGNKLSTSIFHACSVKNIPVVLRLSDFNLLCSKNIFFRDGAICTKCIKNKLSSIKYKCVHNSIVQSTVYFLAQKYNEIKHFEKQIDAIITPSQFTKEILLSSNQFKQSKIFHIPSFIDRNISNIASSKSKYSIQDKLVISYVGRIADDKGIDLLIDAINIINKTDLKVEVNIFGDIDSQFAHDQIVRSKMLGLNNIYFRGYLDIEELHFHLYNSHYTVIPSKWFDNMPNSLIESCSVGTPVIVANIGSLGELIKDGFNGITFEPSNYHNLATVIKHLFVIREIDYIRMSDNTRNWIRQYGSRETHYKSLLNIFSDAINKSNG